MTEQREHYRGRELDYWASGEGLKPAEAELVERWLDPAQPTLDAGTGGGRIARALVERGFGEVTGFDFAPEMVARARAVDPEGRARYEVADATALPYGDGSFGQAIYLEQVISTIGDPEGRAAALREAARVVRPGGVALFSFVCLESRLASRAQRAYVAYLRGRRRLRRDPRPVQSMPRLRLRGRLGPGALRDSGPYIWWYRAGEAEAALRAAGFELAAAGFAPDRGALALRPTMAAAVGAGARGILYAATRRAI